MKGEKFYGVYGGAGKPILMVQDVELAKQIMVKEFHKFADRTAQNIHLLLNDDNLVDRVWKKTMVMANGEEWKDIRTAFSPIFTSGKLKMMSHLINDIAVNRLAKVFEEAAVSGEEIELRSTFGMFTMDSIASCAFGIDAKCFASNGQSPFMQYGKGLFARNFKDAIKFLLIKIPGCYQLFGKYFGLSIFKMKNTMFFYNAIKRTIEERIRTKERRDDLVDLMIDVMKDELKSTEGDEDDTAEQYHSDAKMEHK